MSNPNKPRSPFAVRITPLEIDRALYKVEEHSIDDANLLRSFIRSLMAKISAYELGEDDPKADIYVE